MNDSSAAQSMMYPSGPRPTATTPAHHDPGVRRSAPMSMYRKAHGLSRRHYCLYALACSLIWGPVTGCSPREGTNREKDSAAVTRSASEEGVTLTMTVDRPDVTQLKPFQIEVAATADAGIRLSPIDYAGTLSQSDVRYECRVLNAEMGRPERLADGRTAARQRVEIEFILPGEFELPAASIAYEPDSAESRTDGDSLAPGPKLLSTEPLGMTLAADPSQALSDDDLHTVERLAPVELPSAWTRWWWAWSLSALALGSAAIAMLLRKRRARMETIVEEPAHIWAQRQITELMAEDFLARGMVQAFYYRISGIVRGYIERRFGVSAPEMTTEEFLAAAAYDARLATHHTQDLRSFLTACDIVKYARHMPTVQDSETVLRTACDFVERTRLRPMTPAPTGEAAASREEAA